MSRRFNKFFLFLDATPIRCYCNLPSCKENSSEPQTGSEPVTSFRCLSTQGRCFSEFSGAPGSDQSELHGCVEALSLDERNSCYASSGRGDVITRKLTSQDGVAMLMCCTADLCNYMAQVDPPHVQIDVITRNQSKRKTSKQ